VKRDPGKKMPNRTDGAGEERYSIEKSTKNLSYLAWRRAGGGFKVRSGMQSRIGK